MNLEIKIHKRNKGFCFNKMPYGTSSSEAKRIACMDITLECGENKFYSRNYILREGQVLDNCKKILIILPLDTTIY